MMDAQAYLAFAYAQAASGPGHITPANLQCLDYEFLLQAGQGGIQGRRRGGIGR